MNDITRIKTNPRRGRAVAYNGVLYLGGQVADNWDGDIVAQTREALAKIDKVLAEAGTDKSRLLNVQIWLKDIGRDFAGMNEAWDGWIDVEAAPARATAQCELGAPAILIEIIVQAALPA
ncbi:RidA family protein [Sphingomonas crocodyli]|uniref:RidA family protein n=1 Tax=Sphingomonas crocodyli TaxID=1979270 RepID=A0A437M7J4_9SPHN|nr:RidA family protein [Sphingomonas crocodyli]RVT93505.1 RidA family protein [Sphingomonas crocodyli]